MVVDILRSDEIWLLIRSWCQYCHLDFGSSLSILYICNICMLATRWMEFSEADLVLRPVKHVDCPRLHHNPTPCPGQATANAKLWHSAEPHLGANILQNIPSSDLLTKLRYIDCILLSNHCRSYGVEVSTLDFDYISRVPATPVRVRVRPTYAFAILRF